MLQVIATAHHSRSGGVWYSNTYVYYLHKETVDTMASSFRQPGIYFKVCALVCVHALMHVYNHLRVWFVISLPFIRNICTRHHGHLVPPIVLLCFSSAPAHVFMCMPFFCIYPFICVSGLDVITPMYNAHHCGRLFLLCHKGECFSRPFSVRNRAIRGESSPRREVLPRFPAALHRHWYAFFSY